MNSAEKHMTSSPCRTRRTLAALRTHIKPPPLAILPLLVLVSFTLAAALASRALLHTLSSALFLASAYPAAPAAPPPQAAPVTTSNVAIGARETHFIAMSLPLSRPAQDLVASYIAPSSRLLLVLAEPGEAPATDSSLTLAPASAACEDAATARQLSHPILCTSQIPPHAEPFDRAIVLAPATLSEFLPHLASNAFLFLPPLPAGSLADTSGGRAPPAATEVARVLGDSGIVVYSPRTSEPPSDFPSEDTARLLSTIEGAYDKEARARAVAQRRSRERLALDAIALALAAAIICAARAGWATAATRLRRAKDLLG